VIRVLTTDRLAGKTETIIEWLLQGQSLPHWPFWNRVVICHTEIAAREVRERVGSRVADPYRTAYAPHDLPHVRFGPDVAVAVDEAGLILCAVLRLSREPHIITITGVSA
jgi:hypothetical protein